MDVAGHVCWLLALELRDPSQRKDWVAQDQRPGGGGGGDCWAAAAGERGGCPSLITVPNASER